MAPAAKRPASARRDQLAELLDFEFIGPRYVRDEDHPVESDSCIYRCCGGILKCLDESLTVDARLLLRPTMVGSPLSSTAIAEQSRQSDD